MKRLKHRVAAQGKTSAAAVSGSAASPGGTPQTMPVAAVSAASQGGPYMTVTYAVTAPQYAADGAVYPAQPTGSSGAVVPAGRP